MRTRVSHLLARLQTSREGATAIEYGLIAALISLAALSAITSFGEGVSDTFNTMSEAIDDAS